VRRFPGRLALCGWVVLAALTAGAALDAVAAPPGTKNFTAPSNVPNYFSNEAGSFRGDATARAAQSGAPPSLAAPAPRRTVAAASRRAGRHQVGRTAKARGHVRLARGKAGAHRQVVRTRHGGAVHATAVRSARSAGSKTAHARHGPARTKAVAAKSRPVPAKGKTAAHGRG
jgi:hypothetical protein